MILDMMSTLFTNRLRRMSPKDRAKFMSGVLERLTQNESPEESLRFLFALENRLYKLQGKTSSDYEKGVHPKHRLTGFHDFFVKHVRPGERVVDIGSGIGFLANSLASRIENVEVLGLEKDPVRVAFAKNNFSHPRLRFKCCDVLKELPQASCDVVVLSNILEHVEQRVELLNRLAGELKPKRFIIRVPQYDRDWRVALKDEVGIDSRLSQGHFIEYTKEGFEKELSEAHLKPNIMNFSWGEIWSVASP
jgi:SAM-dependent methyltransferase